MNDSNSISSETEISFDKKTSFNNMLPILLGNTLEAYDFFIYGLLASVFSKIFFSQDNKYSLTLAFFLFFIAYVIRPIGAAFWGYLGDRYGRKLVLLLTVSLMIIPSVFLSITPTYQSIGIAASFILLCLRLIQGFSFSGEWPTVLVTLYESAPDNKKCFFISLTEVSSFIGYSLGVFFNLFLLLMFSNESYLNYGWRLLFLISIFFIIVLAIIRLQYIDQRSKKLKSNPLKEVLKDWKTLLAIVIIKAPGSSLFFFYTYYTRIIIEKNFSVICAHVVNGIMFLTYACLTILPGMLGDKIGFERLFRLSLIVTSVYIFPMLFILNCSNLSLMVFAVVVLAILLSSISAMGSATCLSLTKNNNRLSMFALGHTFSILLFGATSPMLSEFLTIYFQTSIAPGYYLFSITILSFYVVFKLNIKGKENAPNQ